ncbi:MAG TPA: glycosyltransferase family 4 protein [Steroidobacter sp.]
MASSRCLQGERVRLLLVIGSLSGGGAERQMSNIANYWASKGFDVTLATWTGPQVSDFYELDPAVRRVHLDVESRPGEWFAITRTSLRRVLKLRRLLHSARPNAVLSFVTESNVLTVLAHTGLKSRLVVSERIHPGMHSALPWTWKLLRKLVYRWSDAVIAQTREAARWIDLNCGATALVIPNALRPLPDAHEQRQPLILAVGRLVRQKGFDLLLQAFSRIAADFADWNVTIIGDGVEQSRLMSLSRQLQLGERVTFVGQVRNVEDWMARAGIVVQPSRFEGFPNVVLESMGMGAAVVSSDCASGPADLIEDGVNGRLVPVEDIDALSRAITELISQPALRERLGREALRVRQRFHQDLIMAQWEDCLLADHRTVDADVGTGRVNFE